MKFVWWDAGVSRRCMWRATEPRGCEVWGVFDKTATAKRFAEEYGIPKVYASYEEVLADPGVTGVELLVPHHLHCEMTVAACAQRSTSPCEADGALPFECDEMSPAQRETASCSKCSKTLCITRPIFC
jgi:hypothetical protein